MSSTFINHTLVAKEAIRQLKNNCVMGNLVFRGYEEEFKRNVNGWKQGSSVTVKAPVYFRTKNTAALNIVDLLEQSTTFTVSTRSQVSWAVTSEEMTMNIDKFSKRFIQPAMQAIANEIDSAILALYKYICNQVGTPGTTPANFLTFALAGAKMNEAAVPLDDRHCVIDPMCQAYMADHFKGLFNPAMVGNAIERARFGNIAGMDMFMSQNVQTHTCGTAAGLTINLVDDTVAEGDTTINIDQNGSWSGTFKQGDIFTIASVYAVNPISGQSTGSLRQFVADEDESGDATDCDLKCTPGTSPFKIYSASATETYLPYQTVSALPANNAAVAVAGSASLQHKVNLAFHRNALGLVMVPLEMPDSVSWKAQMTDDGYSIRVLKDYDVVNDQEYIRFDALYGVKCLNPFMACRIAG